MGRGRRWHVTVPVVVAAATLVAASLVAVSAAAGAAAQTVGPISNVSTACLGGNAEVEQAVDPTSPGYVYEAWTGCGGIGFAASSNGGVSFAPAIRLPGSGVSPGDPDVAVAPDGTVYVSFMAIVGDQNYPVVDASFDHGVTFPQVTSLVPPDPGNWGDSPDIAVGPDGEVYVTWDYGPSDSEVVVRCSAGGSCSFTKGDLNVVLQVSTDGGQSFGPILPISAGFPWSGADNAPIVVEPSGRLDVLYQGYGVNPKTHALYPAFNYFTSSSDDGVSWSTPVAVGPTAGTMSTVEWWNEPGLGLDAAGDLYAAWDTQTRLPSGASEDRGWLSYSTDGGSTWSAPVQGPADSKPVPHIMEVAGAGPGEAYVGWLSDSTTQGYSFFLRPFAVSTGWVRPAVRVSKLYGNPHDWPGDTFGLSVLSPTRVVAAWGSAVGGTEATPSVYATAVTYASAP